MVEIRNTGGVLAQFEYNNPITGVYCLFDLTTEDEIESESPIVPIVPNELRPSMSVSVNFLRPHFFALEVMPIVAGVATSLGLFIYDPQEERTHAPGISPNVLIETWIAHNDRATKAVANDDDPIRKPYLARDLSLYWWQYTQAREEYQRSLSDDVFVPSILLMADTENRVKLTVIWSADVQRRSLKLTRVPLPQVFPTYDLLLLAWGKPGERFQKTLVDAANAETLLSQLLEPIEGPVQGLRILRPGRQKEACEIYDLLPRFDLEGMQQVAPDGFVDVLVD